MNILESMFISFGLQIVSLVVKDPVHSQQVKTQLLGIADDIYEAYGIAPSPRPVDVVSTAPVPVVGAGQGAAVKTA